MEVRKLFLDYLLHLSSSPLKSVGDLFACDKYQSNKGNLSHMHGMCSIEWNKLTSEQCIELEDIVRASMYDIARVENIDSLIAKGIFKKESEIIICKKLQTLYCSFHRS